MTDSSNDAPTPPEDEVTIPGRPKKKHSLQWLWWVLGVVVALAAAGWISRGWLDEEYQQAPMLEAHTESDARIHKRLKSEVSDHDAELEDNRYINARIEITQQQIQRRLDRNYQVERARMADNWQERDQAEEEVQELEQRIKQVDDALQKSYRKRPAIPKRRGRVVSSSSDDPLAGLDGL